MNANEEQPTKRWVEEAEEALNRTGDALRAAWSETHEARSSALESAKEAAARLGKAIDQGIVAAKKTWDPARDETAQAEGQSDEEE